MNFSENNIAYNAIQTFHQNSVAATIAKSDSVLKNIKLEDAYCSPEIFAPVSGTVQQNFAQNIPILLTSYILVINDSSGSQYFLPQASNNPEIKLKTNLSNDQTENNSGPSGILFNSEPESLTERDEPAHQIITEHTEDLNRCKVQTLADALKPLYKYIVGNKCQLCGFVSKSKGIHRVRRHLATHLETRNFKCDLCEKAFATPACLYSHKSTHQDVPRYSCEKCGKKFRQEDSLTNHVCFTHNSSKKCICSVCDMSFTSYSNLKEHLRIHTGEKPYECAVCRMCFRTSSNMQTHLAGHNPEKRHPCKICGKAYNRKRLLKEHVNTHKNVPAYTCEVCGKAFNFRSNLSQHMLVHSDSRRHTCETCGMKFKLPHHLRNHILTHGLS